MRYSVTYPILRHMLGYTNDQQLHHCCHLMTLGVHVRYQYLGISIFNNVMRCKPMLYNGLQVE